jgi:CRISP-associated protein Cas1
LKGPPLLPIFRPELIFAERSRRPPRDHINAALSFCYAILAGECLAAAAGAGLDPRLGVFHSLRGARPALALDLMEPFRPIVADQVVLTGFGRGQLSREDFEPVEAPSSPTLTADGKRKLVEMLETRLSTSIATQGGDVRTSYREAIGLQAQAIGAALQGTTDFLAMERP